MLSILLPLFIYFASEVVKILKEFTWWSYFNN